MINEGEIEGKKVEVLIPQRFHLKHTLYRNAYHTNPVHRPMGIGRDLHGIKKDGSIPASELPFIF